MPSVRRSSSPVAPSPAQPQNPPPVATDTELAPTGWNARHKESTVAQTTASATSAAAAFKPTLGPIAPAPMLKALGDGTATIDVPLRPGDYQVKGVPFTVKPGTVVHLNVQVKNGELVPVGHGQLGTGAKFDPPLDLPAWVTGQGVELTGDEAQQKLHVELGGMFDFNLKAMKLGDLVSSGDARAVSTGKSGALSELAGQMLDLSKVKVDAKVTLRETTLDLGGAKVQVDPSTTFSVKGDGQHATVSGHVQLDGFSLNQGGIDLSSKGGGHAELTASLDRVATGYQMDSHLSGLQLSLDKLTSSHPSAVVPGKMDQVSLGAMELHDGTLDVSTRVGMNGLTSTGFSAPVVNLAFKASGSIESAQLTVKDARDSATASLRGHFEGSVHLGPGAVKFDGKLSQAHVDVRDLQQTVQGNALSIERMVADGEVRFSNTPGQLVMDGEVKNFDLVVDDFKGGAGTMKADLGRTSVTGNGSFHVGADGLRASGQLRGEATIDSASFSAGKHQTKGDATLGSSTVSGDVTRLQLGKGAPDLRVENVTADVDVQRATLDVGQANLRGGGHVKGTGTVTLNASGFSLDGKGQVSMQLDDGRVHSSTVDLSLAKGSGAELNINELSLGKTSHVKVGPGSKVDVVLAGGSLQVGGTTVELEKGGRAQFSVKHVELRKGKTDLRGSVKLDAKLKAGHVAVDLPGVKVHPADVSGRVKVTIDDAHLADDRLSFSNAQVNLDAKVGRYVGVSTPGQPGVGTLQDAVPVVSVDDVKKSTAAQLAGVTAPAPVTGSPLDALKLLRDGDVKVSVPMQGNIEALGLDVVKLPPGSRLELALAVRDGKIVARDTKATLSGGVKAVGVEVLGVHLDEKLHLHADLKIAGRTVSVPVPGVKVPADMEHLAALASKPGSGKSSSPGSGVGDLIDLGHAQLDVPNATFAGGRLAIPGGAVELTAGSKLSFHGTPLSGELTGAVGLDAVSLTRDDVAMKGSGGRADLRLTYRRDGDKAVVDGSLSNLAMSTDYVVRKASSGDYVSLGKGRMSGGAISLHAELPLDAKGLPQLSGLPTVSNASVSLPSFVGDLKGARMTSANAGTVQLGPSHVEAGVTFSQDKGLTLKGTVDSVDAEVTDAQVRQKGRSLDIEHARFQGRRGSVDLGPDRLLVDAKQLAWDATLREVDARQPRGALKARQVRVSGEGRFSYDSQKDLRVEGKLHLEGRASGDATLAKHVTVNRQTGLTVQR